MMENKQGKTGRTMIEQIGEQINKAVRVEGRVHRVKELKQVVFLILSDRSGYLQCVLSPEQYHQQKPSLESVVALRGIPQPSHNKYGEVELVVQQIDILSRAQELPVTINVAELSLQLDTLLNHRVLCLRNEKESAIFRIQAALSQGFATYLQGKDFLEIHNPKLVQEGAEGGANVFALDYFGRQAYLAQSPQFYKQMAVIAGYERVYEIAPVFRAESHNSNRHLNEYISLDLEMGYIVDEYELMELETDLLGFLLSHLKTTCDRELDLLQVVLPEINDGIPTLTLAEATDILKKEYGLDNEGDLNPESERTISRHIYRTTGSEFVFLTHYPRRKRPMYTLPHENGTTHSFDLIFRGLEITTGGMRISDYDMLVESMKSKGLNPTAYTSYLEAFRYGVPSHGGLAIGLERLTAKLLGLDNLRRASLFPRDMERLIP